VPNETAMCLISDATNHIAAEVRAQGGRYHAAGGKGPNLDVREITLAAADSHPTDLNVSLCHGSLIVAVAPVQLWSATPAAYARREAEAID